MRGESPAAIPFEPVKKSVLMINLPAAHAMGLRVPDALVKRAEKVIE